MTPRSRTVEEMSIFDPAISSGPAGHFFTLPEVPSQMISVLAVFRQNLFDVIQFSQPSQNVTTLLLSRVVTVTESEN